METTNIESSDDEAGVCVYQLLPLGKIDSVGCTKSQCYKTYGDNGYRVIFWRPLHHLIEENKANSTN